MTVVEVVPLVAGAAPIVIGRGVVGAVVGVLRLLVESASLGVLDERLGVEVSRLLAVKSSTHLRKAFSVRRESVNVKYTPISHKPCPPVAHWGFTPECTTLVQIAVPLALRHSSSSLG